MIEKILYELDPSSYKNIRKTIYSYDGIPVPRVTDIISSTMPIDNLIGWANHVGRQGKSNTAITNDSAKKGELVHNAIEDYLQNDNMLDISKIDYGHRFAVDNAWKAFLLWWDIMKNIGAEVLLQEQPLVTKYFGGTLDILIKVNNKKYLLDFKTSSAIRESHVLQLSAYRLMVRQIYGEEVDGVGLIRLSKYEPSFEELILDFSNEFNLKFINDCEEAFLSMVYTYYNRLNIERGFKEVMKNHEMESNAV